MKIDYINSCWCKADLEARRVLKPLMEYKSSYWKKKGFKMEQIRYTASLMKSNGLFPSGFVSKISTLHPELQVSIPESEHIIALKEPHLEGIIFRDDQLGLIKSVTGSNIGEQRGILLSATGTGKTIVAMGLMSCYPDCNILFLCHSISILEQTRKELEKFNFKDVYMIGGGHRSFGNGITLGSIQSFSKMNPEDYADHYDIVIVDEAHHCSSINSKTKSKTSQYASVLMNCLAPVKLGLTATMPDEEIKRMSMEALLGPVLKEFSLNEAVEKDILVKPYITLIPTDKPFLGSFTKYKDIYKHGIVNNDKRNSQAIGAALDRIDKGKNCLIIIKEIEHGENLMNIVLAEFPEYQNDFVFIDGSTKSDYREKVRQDLHNKKIKCVIATVIWVEGINIQSLNSVMLALGGKSSIRTLQIIGRGTRTWEEKDEIEIIDFIDRPKHLSSHFAERMIIYSNNNWL